MRIEVSRSRHQTFSRLIRLREVRPHVCSSLEGFSMLDWKPVAALAGAVLALGAPLSAQEERPPYRVERATSEIKVDGALDEPAWSAAAVVELLYETRPAENQPPPVETRVLLAYDDSNLYVAFDAKDPDPSAIRAHLADRDTAWSDDFVGIVLDPFNDERRAFEFFINPLGVQMDMFNDDVGGNEDESWD